MREKRDLRGNYELMHIGVEERSYNLLSSTCKVVYYEKII